MARGVAFRGNGELAVTSQRFVDVGIQQEDDDEAGVEDIQDTDEPIAQ